MPPVKRLSIGEIHDQRWCPKAVRDGVTDFLQYSANRWGQYTSVLPPLCYFLQQVEAKAIVDLCSGGGGPWQQMHGTVGRTFGDTFRIVLTDRHPNLAAFRRANEVSGGMIEFRQEPVDACAVTDRLPGFRTLFTSFHHFDPDAARAILQSAVDAGEGIGIFEMTERHPRAILAMLTVPLVVLAHVPNIRPFRWSRILFTYLLPVIPLAVMVDGIISCLRSYTPQELAELTASLTGQSYEWEIRRLNSPGSPFPVTYAIGCPSKA